MVFTQPAPTPVKSISWDFHLFVCLSVYATQLPGDQYISYYQNVKLLNQTF